MRLYLSQKQGQLTWICRRTKPYRACRESRMSHRGRISHPTCKGWSTCKACRWWLEWLVITIQNKVSEKKSSSKREQKGPKIEVNKTSIWKNAMNVDPISISTYCMRGYRRRERNWFGKCSHKIICRLCRACSILLSTIVINKEGFYIRVRPWIFAELMLPIQTEKKLK